MAKSSYSCVIPVTQECIKDETGTDEFWTLTSDSLPGFVMGGRDLEAMHSDVPDAIRILFKHNYDMDVDVFRVTAPQDIARDIPESELSTPEAWTAIPQAA